MSADEENQQGTSPEGEAAEQPEAALTESNKGALDKMRQRLRSAAAAGGGSGPPPEARRTAGASDRFEKFTEGAKRVLVLAQQEAQALNHNYIGTEHQLLGLIAESDGIAAQVLVEAGVELNKSRAAVEYIIGRGDRLVIGDISLTPRAKKVIELAADEARHLKHASIGTEHLLLGLIREGAGIAIGVVESLGVSPETLRQQTLARLPDASDEPSERASAALPEIGGSKGNAKGGIITCRVDSGDEDAIDALVEAGIRSTRSDAAAWLIHAGIQANLDLFDKVYTTIAEIRRLREQAQAAARELDTKRPPTQADS